MKSSCYYLFRMLWWKKVSTFWSFYKLIFSVFLSLMKKWRWIFGGTADKMHINGAHKRRSDENVSVHFRSFYGATVKMLGNAKCLSSLNSPSLSQPLLEWQIWSVSAPLAGQPVGILAVGDPPFLRSTLISPKPLPQHDTHPKTCWGQKWWCILINKVFSAKFYAGQRCLKH